MRHVSVGSTPSSQHKIKRFYKEVAVVAVPEGGFGITLDSRRVRTPKGKALVVPDEFLAHCVASEWDNQETIVDRSLLNLTSLCNTAVDDVSTVGLVNPTI